MLLKNKLGQITIFIIIGIVIVMAASFVFFLARNVSSIDTKQALSAGITETQSIKNFVQDCVDNAAEQSIILLGLQGGHVYLPDKKIKLQDYSIVYDYYEGQDLLPTKEQIEEDIAKHVSESVVRCVDEGKNNFNSELAFGEIKTVAKLNDKEVSFDVSYPIIIKYFEKTEQLNDKFKAKVDVRLSYMLDTANSIIGQQIEDPNWFNISYINQIDLKVEVFPHDNNEYIYLLTDTKAKINNRNYTFLFANKFKDNLPPSIMPIPSKKIKPGERLGFYAYAIDPEGDDITFSTGSEDVLKIEPKTGWMRFYTPTNPDGTPIIVPYIFTIKATDSHGNYAEQKVRIEVAE